MFPFDYQGNSSYSCIKFGFREYDDPDSIDNDWYCRVDVGGKEAWGKCNEHCLDDEGISKNDIRAPIMKMRNRDVSCSIGLAI